MSAPFVGTHFHLVNVKSSQPWKQLALGVSNPLYNANLQVRLVYINCKQKIILFLFLEQQCYQQSK